MPRTKTKPAVSSVPSDNPANRLGDNVVMMRAGDLADSPWHFHEPDDLLDEATEASMRRSGVWKPLLAWRRPDGTIAAFDGHRRKRLNPDWIVPVLVSDLSDAEAREAILLADPMAALAAVNPEKLRFALEGIDFGADTSLTAVLEDMKLGAGLTIKMLQASGENGEADTIGDFDPSSPDHHRTPDLTPIDANPRRDDQTVTIFFREAQFREFSELVQHAQQMLGTENLADTVLEALRAVADVSANFEVPDGDE